MVWQHVNFPTLLHKKGTFTYSDSNPGDSRNQKMWRCCSLIASDYMKFCINPLRLVSVPPPPPPPPDTSPAPSFSGSVAYRHPCSLLHVVYRGVPKQFPLTKVPGIQLFEKIFPVFFFSAAWHPRIFATPFAKKCTPSFISYQPENPFPVLFRRYSFSHSSLMNANYSCRRTFWNLPA